jgi:hypothetical protein
MEQARSKHLAVHRLRSMGLKVREIVETLGISYTRRHGKSPTGLCGTPNRRGLLCGVNG